MYIKNYKKPLFHFWYWWGSIERTYMVHTSANLQVLPIDILNLL